MTLSRGLATTPSRSTIQFSSKNRSCNASSIKHNTRAFRDSVSTLAWSSHEISVINNNEAMLCCSNDSISHKNSCWLLLSSSLFFYSQHLWLSTSQDSRQGNRIVHASSLHPRKPRCLRLHGSSQGQEEGHPKELEPQYQQGIYTKQKRFDREWRRCHNQQHFLPSSQAIRKQQRTSRKLCCKQCHVRTHASKKRVSIRCPYDQERDHRTYTLSNRFIGFQQQGSNVKSRCRPLW